jgi:hypothetical protein
MEVIYPPSSDAPRLILILKLNAAPLIFSLFVKIIFLLFNTCVVASCHTGLESLPLLVTNTVIIASLGIEPSIFKTATEISPSTASALFNVISASVTFLVKVKVKDVESFPSLAMISIVCLPFKIV